ncbi:MAG: hypothetical protein B7Y15_05805 [Bacteroidetes bacterium 24-39-8]|nr:MAG: hypothetical protein B7Y69_03885 [Sphingobacteriia bacterium 35-40-8]OYZ51466.1 MAG: hypothetical protein B7Y15_05805 [Bacteroidetes bacterium 24-39-8]OZA68323.1 MAG: hypothetical protein B7X72_02000 [Sphingobacteriia bacterium 39-39-8]HQR91825.1 DUF423 domain-containing protein [Sediminibacterium sp.]HQS54888.1 DUF423 domain-containing protein [Sediminibacterium sp.]
MHKRFFITAAILGALTVAMGAFGAHALKAIVPAEALTIYETAVKYQFYHVFALALTSMLYEKFPNQSLINACACFIVGMAFFSGSLYILTIKAATGIEWLKYVGPFTPVGGLFFIAGWLQLAWGVKKG